MIKLNELLRVENLKKYFETREGLLHAVDDVSFSINAGTTLGVVGESGCGKSTLGRVILHLLKASSGKIFFEHNDISNLTKTQLHALRKDMQIIFQDPYASINPRMTVSELIGEPSIIYKLHKTKEEYSKKVRDVMDIVGLSSRTEYAYPHELDGGRRQRIGIGRALMLDPKFIVCDEPVSALDVSIQAQILNLMQDLQEERDLTYLFITHDLSVVQHISDEILVMYLGVVVERAETKLLFKRQFHPYTQALISAIPSIDLDNRNQRIILKDEIISPINPPNNCRFAPRCRYAKERCFNEMPKLREIEKGHFVACHFAEEI